MTESGLPAAGGAARHRLAPLLTPESVALIGASPKAETVGNGMIKAVRRGGFEGRVYLINPNYETIEGQPCYPSLAELPETVDLAVIGVANARIEQQLAEAIRLKARAAAIFASCYLPDDSDPPLTRRISAMAHAAGMPICGGNGMGFYNFDHRLLVCGFPPPDWVGPGNMTLITHSGSVFSALCHNDRRFRYNLAVSSGQELATTAADYLDYALDQESTRVVGLFLETVRDPAGFIAALQKAQERDIPVVALKVGRTAESAALAVSHSGAIAGDHAAYQAVFDRYGVVEVDDLDSFANAMLLLGHSRRVATGGLASIHDSGGERELLVDRAIAKGVPFARINEATTAKLGARLDHGLDPINPLDAWGTGHDYEAIFADCMSALVEDPDTAIGALFVETRSGQYLNEGYARAAQVAAARTDKPVVIVNNLAAVGDDDLTVRLTEAGIPVLVGIDPGLTAIRAAFARRDFRARPPMTPPAAPPGIRARWEARLRAGNPPLDEAESLTVLADYGLPVLPHAIVEDGAAAVSAGRMLGFPVALKTAMPGILHKSDVGGVKLGLADAAAVTAAYDDLARRLGPRALVTPMAAEAGTELAFGSVYDAQFGPLVLVGAGGVLIELLRDRAVALPPFDAAAARRLLDRLAVRPLLDGRRGMPPADLDSVAVALAAFSAMIADLAGLVQEVDINPVLAGPSGCRVLDALIVPRQAGAASDGVG